MNSSFVEIHQFLQGDDIIYFQEKRLDKEQSTKEVKLILDLIGSPGHSLDILDIPCGFGRHCIPYSRLGHRIVGIDISRSFIEYAQNSARNEYGSLRFNKVDMLDFSAPDSFDFISNLFNSFGYYDRAGNQRLVSAFYEMLRPGGKVLIDTLNEKSLDNSGFLDEVWLRRDEDRLRITKTRSNDSGLVDYKMEVFRGGVQRHTRFSVQHYDQAEMQQLMKKAGFSKFSFFADLAGNPFDPQGKKLIVLAEK